jgi:Uma2 family endonuclease
MASKTLLTLEQFERLPDDGMSHELDEGELLSMPPALTLHGIVLTEIVFLLRRFSGRQKLGLVITGVGFRLAPDTVRAPDVSFIRAERVRALDLEQRFEGAPDLAVEVISPSESAADIAHKVRQYLRAGVEIVWVVYPRDCSVHVFEPSGSARILEAGDLLEAPAILPDFSVCVSELFA